jgi:hypothetical protein
MFGERLFDVEGAFRMNLKFRYACLFAALLPSVSFAQETPPGSNSLPYWTSDQVLADCTILNANKILGRLIFTVSGGRAMYIDKSLSRDAVWGRGLRYKYSGVATTMHEIEIRKDELDLISKYDFQLVNFVGDSIFVSSNNQSERTPERRLFGPSVKTELVMSFSRQGSLTINSEIEQKVLGVGICDFVRTKQALCQTMKQSRN